MNWPLTDETVIIPRYLIRRELEADRLHRAHCVAQHIGDVVYDAIIEELGGAAAAIAYTAAYQAVYEEMTR